MNVKFFTQTPARSIRRGVWLAVAAVAFSGAVVAQNAPSEEAKPETEAAEEEFKIPESVFLSEPRDKSPKEGVDPFFPASKRRDPIPKGPTPEELAEMERLKREQEEKEKETAPPPPPDPFDDLTLKAVIGGSRPMATIGTSVKNYYFAPGEWRMVLVPNHIEGGERMVRLECVSVSAKGVTLKIDNKDDVRPLKLPMKPIGN